MSLFSHVEKNLDLRFRKWTEKIFGASQSDDLVLLRRAILDEIESKVTTIRRGKRLFPYNHLRIRFKAADSARRELLIAAFGENLLEDIRECLSRTGCDQPAGLSLDIETIEAGPEPFEILYEVQNAAAATGIHQPACLKVVSGKANREVAVLDGPRLDIGRLAEIVDRQERIVRRNDLVFDEILDELNSSVSRAHAHIVFEPAAGEYRIYDDSSEYGTRIFRGGRSIQVPPGSRGERLVPGDEIYLGRVRVRFDMPSAQNAC
jgi:FHA domain